MNQFNSDVLQRLNVAVAIVNAWSKGELNRDTCTVFQDHGYRPPTTRAEWTAVTQLVERLSKVLALIAGRDDAAAISLMNDRLSALSVTPRIEQRGDKRLLHFHTDKASFADGWDAGIAAALAVAYSTNDADRIGACRAPGCTQYFLDLGRNKQRRFCSLQCQNRAKSLAYRRRMTDR